MIYFGFGAFPFFSFMFLLSLLISVNDEEFVHRVVLRESLHRIIPFSLQRNNHIPMYC